MPKPRTSFPCPSAIRKTLSTSTAPKNGRKIDSPRKPILICKVIISASASLSGGPAQNAERKLRLKKKLKKKYFLQSLSPIYILIDLHPRGNLAIFTLIFVFSIFWDDRSPRRAEQERHDRASKVVRVKINSNPLTTHDRQPRRRKRIKHQMRCIPSPCKEDSDSNFICRTCG